ncbi:p2x purinoceptor 4 [Stylonychia lemnae]|uniref:p2x purinoceptor 4 n=1 Tax=Stylonychia lemnae TaxID=5949 RepID=A0A078A1T0_STYLE|nr:p2x purinoceptor 4 [Stylonychia lemnae]|eukprot:CDW76075.1 p2x purinoceptor 4 [Stylonychia lemnae]
MYYSCEKTLGGSSIKPIGLLVGQDNSTNETRAFDQGDYAQTIEETSAIFIATKIAITSGQTQMYCKIRNCTKDADCKFDSHSHPMNEQVCMSNGFCKDYQWCPYNGDPVHTQIYVMQNLLDLHFEYLNVIQFGSDAETEDIIYHTNPVQVQEDGMRHPVFYPKQKSNAISMGTLIESNNIEVNQLVEKGAIIKMVFDYYCDLRYYQCEPLIEFQKLSEDNDNPITIESSILFTDSDDGTQYREFYQMTGLRLIVQVQGEGNFISIASIILQISSGLALLNIVATVCDLIMLYCPLLKKEHREKYNDYKIEDSEDFSNLQEKIDLIEKEQEKRLKKIKKERKKANSGR